MLQNIKQKREDGFTIIEVLIVLAIAGLIMIVVFLAVPALQRNSRNNSRTTDVNNLASAVSEYAANNEGKIPTNSTELDSAKGNTKLGFYTGTVSVATGIQTALAATDANTSTGITYVHGAKCGTSGATVAGSARQFAIQFVVEGGSAAVPRCQNG